MTVIETPEDVRKTLWAFLDQVTKDEELRPTFVAANAVILMKYTHPDCSILMDLTQDPPIVTWAPDTSESERSDVTLTMTAEDAHLLWLGELSAMIAMARKRIRVTGTIAKMLKLIPAMQPAYRKYQVFLESNGFTDKVPTS